LRKVTGGSATSFSASFLAQARGSHYELETQVQLCHDLSYFNKESADKLLSSCHEVAKMINGLLRAIKANDPTT
jgi:four helix bundle protein